MAVTEQQQQLLDLFRDGKERYGLEVIERLRLNPGVYRHLRALERDGLLETRASEPIVERGNRPRIYYRITALGRAVLDR